MTTTAPLPTTALTRVRVFDGTRVRTPSTVVIRAGRIASTDADQDAARSDGTHIVDGEGAVLLPGLIDTHVHLTGPATLEQLRDFGVTTALDMGSAPAALVRSLRARPGLTDIRSAGVPAIAPGSPHSRIPLLGQLGLVSGIDDVERFVAERVAEGSDYLKIVVSAPAPSHDRTTLRALVVEAHRHGLMTVAHTASYPAVEEAHQAGVDVLTHVPLDRPLDAAQAARISGGVRCVIPTLTMMEATIAQSAPPGADYTVARASVGELHRAGVPILAGTDANSAPGVPAAVEHGESLHHELELLVDAGLSTLDALRAATAIPARHFGLTDRGTIAPGLRADLLLVDGHPLHDIRATRSIRTVWCGGVEYTPT